jgi:hypothetical protein
LESWNEWNFGTFEQVESWNLAISDETL